MLSHVGKFVSGHVGRALHWNHRPPATENNAFEGLEMIPLNDLQRGNYASVSLEDLEASGERARPLEPSSERAAWPPPPLVWLLPAALELLALPLRSRAVRRALAAEQRFMYRRVCSRFERVLWTGWATLIWGLLLTLVSACGIVLALTGDLGNVLGKHPGLWFVQFSTYLMAYLAVVHVAQVICALLLLTAVKMAETSSRLRDPTEQEILQWFSSLGFPTVDQSCQPLSPPSESLTPAPLPASSPERTPAVLQVHAQVEHNPDGEKPGPYARSPEAVKCVGSRLDRASESSMGSSPDGQGATQRKSIRGSSLGASTVLQSMIEEIRDEDTAARTSNDKRARKQVRLRSPWLWAAAVTLLTYIITAVAFYCSGSVAIPTTLCAIIVLSTPCILDVLADVLEVPEKHSEDLERLFGTSPSDESRVETGQPVTARSPEEDALDDRSSPEFNEESCSLQLRDLSSE